MVNSEELIGTVDYPTVGEVSYKPMSLQPYGLFTCTYTPVRTHAHTHTQAYRHTRFGLEKECYSKFVVQPQNLSKIFEFQRDEI